MKKTGILSMVILLAAAAGTMEAKEIKKNFHESFAVDRGDTLRLRHGDGNVFIRPWDRDTIDITVRYHVDETTVGIGPKHDFDVEFRQSGNTVYVLEKRRSGLIVGFHNRKTFEYVYEIQAPDYIRLDTDGDDGDIEIEQWRGTIDCRMDDGDIHFRDIDTEQTSIRANDGDIHITALSGDLTVKCDDGDIEMEDCRSESVRLEAEDGKLTIRNCSGAFFIRIDDADVEFQRTLADELEITGNDGHIDLDLLRADNIDAVIRMDDGDVDVRLERGFSLSFSTRTDDGRVRINLQGIDNFEEEKHIKSGKINGGKGSLRIHTNDGRISISER